MAGLKKDDVVRIYHGMFSEKPATYVVVKDKDAIDTIFGNPNILGTGEDKEGHWFAIPRNITVKNFMINTQASFIEKIKIIAGDLLDLNQRIKEKKVEDKKDKIESLKPDFDKAVLRISFSQAYAGGYELTCTLPVPADFFRKEKHTGGTGEFIRQMHEFIQHRIGKYLGTPFFKKEDRAKGGYVNAQAMWHFHDAFFAYALGLDLDQFMGSNEVVTLNDIHKRKLLAEKAYKELIDFRSLANKKLQLRSQDKDEKNKIWQEEFMPEWMKLSNKWKEKGINFVHLSDSKRNDREVAVGSFTKKIHQLSK